MVDYTKFVDMIHNYTNRDETVLPNSLIKNFADFASDDIYRTLRIPPLEATFTYDALTAETDKIGIPGDAIEFIQLRKLDSDGDVDVVYNARSDIRSFYIDNMTKYDGYYYTREVNDLIVYPKLEVGDVMQLHYYKRLPSIYARYSITDTNNSLGLLYYDATSAAALQAIVEAAEPGAFDADPDLLSEITQVTGDLVLADGWYLGQLAGNWLRDENLKTLLYGTQAEAYVYLKDAEKAEAFFNLRNQEIQELNREAMLRAVRGGVAQTHYSGGCLL